MIWKPLAIALIVTPAFGEDFADRWPRPIDAIDPAPVVEPVPVQRAPKAVRRAMAHQRGFVCHRQTYYVGRHRYWRCRR